MARTFSKTTVDLAADSGYTDSEALACANSQKREVIPLGWTKNFSHPDGLLGRLVLASMNRGHTPISKWGLGLHEWQPDTVALDIGCGGGMNLKRLLERFPQGKAYGVDISELSVRRSRALNRAELGHRCLIRQGSADSIPYPSSMFDAVTAFETLYFWPDLPRAFAEISRVLKPGCTFLSVSEISDPHSVWTRLVDGIRVYSPEQLARFLTNAGFVNVRIDRIHRSWSCVRADKPQVK